jgi:hypothetical protein
MSLKGMRMIIVKSLFWFYRFFYFNKTINRIKGSKGAVILEYVLLLLACLGCAMVIKEAVEISGNKDESGWFIRTWMAVITTIAEDM